MDVVHLRFNFGGTERICTADFVQTQLKLMMDARSDGSYEAQDWAFKLHTLAEWLNSTKQPIIIRPTDTTTPIAALTVTIEPQLFYLVNVVQNKPVPVLSFGRSKY
jgi:hypothetical protein